MSSSSILCKGEQIRRSEEAAQTKKLNLPNLPKACAEPVLSKPCGSINSTKPISGTETPHGGSSTKFWEAECTNTSYCILAPTFSTTQEFITTSQPPTSAHTTKPAPIRIPHPTLHARDINRVSTPLSGRGDRKGHLFPYEQSYSGSSSPRGFIPRSYKEARTFSDDSDEFFGRLERVRSVSSSSIQSVRSKYGLSRHDPMIGRGYPASPLSPKLPARTQTRSPQPSHRRGNHGRQVSRNMQLNLGRYHPSNFPQADSSATPSSSSMQAPSITYTRAPPATQVESPRLLREKHREFLDKTRLSSKLAASPLAVKPDAPRLDPLGSPKGPVTPLALAEEAGDYFSVVGAGRISPVGTPGARTPRSNRSSSVSSNEDSLPEKRRKVEIYP